MKRLITGFVIATPFVGFVSCFAAPTTLYVDEGAIIFCRNENRADVLSDVSFFDIEVAREVKTRALKLEYPILDPDEVSPLYARRFPRAWHVEKGVLSILFPDFLASATGDIYIKLATVRNVSGFCAESANWNSTGLDYRVSTEGAGCLASIPFAVPLARRHGFAELMAPWYALGEKSLVSRLPYDGKGLQWSPLCAETCYGWGEFVLGVNVSQSCQSVAERQTSCDSYNPVAGVWVLGKNVVSDNPRFVLPSGADWLIWECGEKTSRICKMKEGRWSVVTNASCEDVPSLIVVNNDENSVFLSFSFKFDENDMSASMRGVTAYLMEHDVLHRDKLKSAVRNSGAELSAFEKSCVEDEIEQARIIDESLRSSLSPRATRPAPSPTTPTASLPPRR